MPTSKRVEQKIVVYLYSGILCSRKKEGAPTLHNSMDGPGEHYAEWNKPSGERQIPYDLTYKWNLINNNNKNKWAKRTDGEQEGGERGMTVKRRGRVKSRNKYKRPMEKDNGGGVIWFWGGGQGRGE